jgi:mono/diheme cytochrome c family protein
MTPRDYAPGVAKRKPTSRPRGDRARQAQRKAERSAKPRTPARTRPAPAGPGPLARAWAVARRYSFGIVLVLAIGGGVAIGVRQGRDAAEKGFGDTTTAATTEAPFRSEQEAAKGRPVKDVFAHTCGTCHTLRRAGVRGIIGPDLDAVVLTTAKVRRMIATGSLDTVMPKNLLVGRDADRVARYVAEQSLASRRARARARRS